MWWSRAPSVSRHHSVGIAVSSLIRGVSRINRSSGHPSADTLSGTGRRRHVTPQPKAHTTRVGPVGIEPTTRGLKVRCSAG